MAQYRQQGSVCDLPKSGRPCTARSDKKKKPSPISRKCGRRSSQIGVSRSSLHRMLHKEDKVLLMQKKLQPRNHEKTAGTLHASPRFG